VLRRPLHGRSGHAMTQPIVIEHVFPGLERHKLARTISQHRRLAI
jgi:hypothetical protein